jgi:hypothetical protein
MKRLESWLVIIDAEHMASALKDASAHYQFFPITEIRSPHFNLVSLRAIDRCTPQSPFCDLGVSSTARAAEIGCP